MVTEPGQAFGLLIGVLGQALGCLVAQLHESLRLLGGVVLQAGQRIRGGGGNPAVHFVHVGGEILQHLRAANLVRGGQIAVLLGQVAVHDAELTDTLGARDQLVRLVHNSLHGGAYRRMHGRLRDGQ